MNNSDKTRTKEESQSLILNVIKRAVHFAMSEYGYTEAEAWEMVHFVVVCKLDDTSDLDELLRPPTIEEQMRIASISLLARTILLGEEQ